MNSTNLGRHFDKPHFVKTGGLWACSRRGIFGFGPTLKDAFRDLNRRTPIPAGSHPVRAPL